MSRKAGQGARQHHIALFGNLEVLIVVLKAISTAWIKHFLASTLCVTAGSCFLPSPVRYRRGWHRAAREHNHHLRQGFLFILYHTVFVFNPDLKLSQAWILLGHWFRGQQLLRASPSKVCESIRNRDDAVEPFPQLHHRR